MHGGLRLFIPEPGLGTLSRPLGVSLDKRHGATGAHGGLREPRPGTRTKGPRGLVRFGRGVILSIK